jgi:hypothetical protein
MIFFKVDENKKVSPQGWESWEVGKVWTIQACMGVSVSRANF